MPQTSAVIVEKESSGKGDSGLDDRFRDMANVVTCGNFAVKRRGGSEKNGLGNLLRIVRCHNFRTAKSS